MDYLYRQAYQIALTARQPLLVSHAKPDGDTLGAMMAFGHALDAAGKEHVRFCVDVPPRQYGFMPGIDRVVSDTAVVRTVRPDAVFVFDAGDLRFAGVDQLLSELGPQHIVNIDHHVSNGRFGTLNVVVVDASSTAEVVHRLLVANALPITHGVATCLLTGLCYDTSTFSNPATSAPALAVGAALLRHGGKFSAVLTHLVHNKTVSTLRLWGIALSRLAYNEQYGTASTVITLQDLATTQAEEEATEGLSNFLNAVLDVPTVMVLRELQGGFIRGSLRTTGDRDVSLVARALGGGGHKKAAGFTMRGQLLEQNGRWQLLVAN